MQQRQPRLGDIVDDYCPRERRITNHAVVALVGDEVRQTRCTTCDSEHEFKQAKVPPQRRKKEAPGALYQQVLAGMPRKVVPAGLDAPPDSSDDTALMVETEPEAIAEEPAEGAPVAVGADDADGPVHRPLIRATLPRLTDDPPQRREPEFTMRGPIGPRPGKFGKNGFRGHRPDRPDRLGGHSGGHQANGNRAANGNRDASGNRAPGGKRHGHGPHRPGGGRPGPAPHGSGRGPRPGGHGRGGKKSPR
jgi:hypothetical protein